MLHYIGSDDEFDRYLAPQTVSNRHMDKDINSGDDNELFSFTKDVKPIPVDSESDKQSNIVSITVYLQMLKALCQKPLLKRITSVENNYICKIKGKVIVEKNIRFNTCRGRNDRIYCKHIEQSTNIPENRILKAALLKCKTALNTYFQSDLRALRPYTELIGYCEQSLKNVNPYDYFDTNRYYTFSGCYTHYKQVVNLAKTIINYKSPDYSTPSSNVNYVIPYSISMDTLFEAYVRAYLKRNGINSYKKRRPNEPFLEKYDTKIDVLSEELSLESSEYIKGPIKPDIIIRMEGRNPVVLDVKYKNHKNKYSAREDRLQLLAYALMLDCIHVGHVFPGDNNHAFLPTNVNSNLNFGALDFLHSLRWYMP